MCFELREDRFGTNRTHFIFDSVLVTDISRRPFGRLYVTCAKGRPSPFVSGNQQRAMRKVERPEQKKTVCERVRNYLW